MIPWLNSQGILGKPCYNALSMKTSEYLNGLIATLQRPKFAQAAKEVAGALREVRNHDGRVYTCGNGGSSALASHFAQDLRKNITPGMKAYCLSDSVPFLTATANDDAYGKIFSDTLIIEELQKKDALVAISCSGNSENVLEAMREAARQNATILAFTGRRESQITEQFLRYEKKIFFFGIHPVIEGEEDLLHVACHMVIREMMQ